MKTSHTFLTGVFLCFLVTASYGQTEKGTLLLGSTLKFSSSKTKNKTSSATTTTYSTSTYEYKQISISIDPNVSYFVADRLAVGLITPYSYTRTKRGDTNEHSNSYSIGPVVRYYFLLGSRWAIFPEASYSYGWTWSRGPYVDFTDFPYTPPTTHYYSTTETTRIFHGGVGGVYFLNKSVGLEGKVYYQSVRNSFDYEHEVDPAVVHSKLPAVALSFGVQVYFSRKVQ
ncbi:hypothetical protein SAMN04488109_3689 [Chryseolinea serpens]|uniref:Outer membrane protein beta-barrel domain-containing protein n=1 Tax=Chryseolinea serpens TaxID=947013 RepID=A0A1M5S250_9BACT|nr:hypothetical protein [Chryseolinea serpens]SHH32103.1 hypothetical protein SAMN04488109_3689 [Chryseolinea serpens]